MSAAGAPAGLAARIEARLAVLEPESLALADDSAQHAGHPGAAAGSGHFSLVIVSAQFAGRSRQARHRLVHAALGEMLGREIHAIAIKAYTPDEI